MAHLALFDLDHTLLDIDSDHAWGEFLIHHGLVDATIHRQKNDQFYKDYQQGQLDAVAYNEFVFEFLSQHSFSTLHTLHQQFMQEFIIPNIRPKALQAIKQHQQLGHTLAVITATNRFITAPIVQYVGIEHLIATTPEMQQQRYTGKLDGVPCVGEGKLIHLDQWLHSQQQKGIAFAHSTAYSDSFNDLPLLSRVDHAVAVTPDTRLHAHAAAHHWPILDWSLPK